MRTQIYWSRNNLHFHKFRREHEHLAMCFCDSRTGDSKSPSTKITSIVAKFHACRVWISKYFIRYLFSPWFAPFRSVLFVHPKTNKFSENHHHHYNWLWLIDEYIISEHCFAFIGHDAWERHGEGETNLKWIESICVSFSATIYRKTHEIKIYVHAVVTRTAHFFLSELQKKKKRKINSNGIWLTLQISFCYEKVKRSQREQKKTRKKFFIRSFLWARMLFHRCSHIWTNRLLL